MLQRLSRWRAARRDRRASIVDVDSAPVAATDVAAPPVDIAPDDPALVHFQHAGGPVDLDDVTFDSPAVRNLRAAGVKLVVRMSRALLK